MPNSISDILAYAFLEMLNNAIEHSNSKTVNVEFCRGPKSAFFKIIDKGVGIFNNIKSKKKLKNEKEAIEDLLKGKQTTEPQAHSGEGIFFTSKVATAFTIQSNTKKIVFDNLIKDVFIKDSKPTKGTKIYFSILLDSKNNLREVFNKYSDDSFKFNKTEVKARLYKSDTEYISRSQARRILSGLDKFKTILLDFKNVETVGQGFADEVFRVWKSRHPGIEIIVKNANDNVQFMINHVT